MSEGKFSQPRPHRDEERQIEESFRQLTEDKHHRRQKEYHVEEDIQKTVREISAQEVSLPQETGLPFERSAKLEQTVQISPEQIPPRRPAAPPQPSKPAPKYDLIPEDLDTFFEKYQLFALWRYDFVDEVPMPDPIQDAHLRQGVPGLPVIAVDYGNKTNYRTDEDVVISTFTENDSEVEICRGGEVIECVKVPGRSRIVRRFDRGYYTIVHKATGSTVEFCVTDPQIRHSVENGMLIIKADPCDPESRISHLEFRERSKGETQQTSGGCEGFEADVRYDPRCASLSKMEELTDEEKKTGEFARKIPSDAVNFKVSFENRYGFWTHTMIKIE